MKIKNYSYYLGNKELMECIHVVDSSEIPVN
jgi:hypothetical protein